MLILRNILEKGVQKLIIVSDLIMSERLKEKLEAG